MNKSIKKTLLATLIAIMLAMSSMALVQIARASTELPPAIIIFPPHSTEVVVVYSNSEPYVPIGFTSPDPVVLLPPLPGLKGSYYIVGVISGSFSGKAKIGIPYDPTGMTIEQQRHLRLCIGDPVDFNGDGTVGRDDIAMIRQVIKSGVYNPYYDINHDGLVNEEDLDIVQQFAHHGLIVHPGHDCNNKPEGRLPWLDITTYVDTVNHYVWGETDHFSGFGVH